MKTIGKVMPNKEYHEHEALGSTNLKDVLENARAYKYAEKETTEPMLIGSVFHTLTLEPENFDKEFKIVDKLIDKALLEVDPSKLIVVNMKTKNNQAFKYAVENANDDEIVILDSEAKLIEELREYKDKEFITKEIYDKAKTLSKKALESELVIEADDEVIFRAKTKDLIEVSHVEESFFWHESIEGFDSDLGIIQEFKCRPDILINVSPDQNRPYWIVCDLKSAIDATAENFAQSSGKYFYYMQEAHYRVGLLESVGINVEKYFFLVSGKNEWSQAEYVEHSQVDVELGFDHRQKALNKFGYCYSTNTWSEKQFDFAKGRFKYVAEINLPAYTHYRFL